MSIKDIRETTGLSQESFGRRYYSIPKRTIQNWEGNVNNCPPYLEKLLDFRVNYDTNVKVMKECIINQLQGSLTDKQLQMIEETINKIMLDHDENELK